MASTLTLGGPYGNPSSLLSELPRKNGGTIAQAIPVTDRRRSSTSNVIAGISWVVK